MSLAIQIADAIVTLLTAAPFGTFAIPFTAERKLAPSYTLEELGAAVRVAVVPKSVEETPATRSTVEQEWVVDLGVLGRCDPTDDRAADPYLTLVEALGAYLRFKQLATTPGVAWKGQQNTPIYSPKHLLEHGQFLSVLSVTYGVIR